MKDRFRGEDVGAVTETECRHREGYGAEKNAYAVVHKLSFCSNADLQTRTKEKWLSYAMKNIVFDLGGVLFARDKNKSTQEFHEFFSFTVGADAPFLGGVRPGASTLGEVTDMLCPDDRLPARKVRTFSAAVDRHGRNPSRRPNGSSAT